MPVWEDLFGAVQRLTDIVGGLQNASFYLHQLMITHWWQAVSAVRQHVETSGESPPSDEVIFLWQPVLDLMLPLVCETATVA